MGYTKEAKPSISWLALPLIYFLLREQGDYLLTETGGKIIISGDHPLTSWSKDDKGSTSWSKEVKPSIP